MKLHQLVFCGFALVLAVGCSNNEEAVSDDEIAANAEGVTQSLTGQAKDDSISDAVPYTPPFPEKVDFFSPPEIEEPDVEVPVAGPRTDRGIRVLGFVQLQGEPEQVVIEVQGELQVVGAGEAVQGVTIVSVNEPDVVLQQSGKRWSLALFDQPLRDEMIAMNSEFDSDAAPNNFFPSDDLNDEAVALPDIDDDVPGLPGLD